MQSTYSIGPLALGEVPRVVGALSDPASLQDLAELTRHASCDGSCDILEFRLDTLLPETSPWLDAALSIEESGKPVFVTPRLRSEGGRWDADNSARRDLLEQALQHLASVDIESTSELLPEICACAAQHEKNIIVSYHNFDATPSRSELHDILAQLESVPHAIPKIATMIRVKEDCDKLIELLSVAPTRPRSIIGMGDKWQHTRIEFPAQGSCLTYGFFDIPCAPGQIAADKLVAALRDQA